MTNETIVVLQARINDGTIKWFKKNDSNDVHLREIIDAYAISLRGLEKEIFDRGNDYIVCEDCIYFAAYEKDLDEEENFEIN